MFLTCAFCLVPSAFMCARQRPAKMPIMVPRAIGVRVGGLTLLSCLVARSAEAQLPADPYVAAGGRVTLAGEFSGIAGRHDTTAFFNYTDYDHDALRIVRARLLGEWRLTPRVAMLGELRTENRDSIEIAALYARWRPWARREFDVQVGRIPPVIGAFARRAYGRDNPVIGTPLAYQYLTSLRPDALPATVDDLLRMRARGWRPSFPIGSQETAPGLPLVSAFRWDTGVEAHWRAAWLELSGALTRGAPAVPVVRETNDGREWSGRAAVAAAPGLTVGVSAARGDWIDRRVLSVLPDSRRHASAQSIVGADLEFGRSRLLVRAEWLRSVFQVPILASTEAATSLTAWSGFVESRYRLNPRWQVATRAERLSFGSIAGTINAGRSTPWDAPVTRVEGVIGFRATRNLELRTGWQENWRAAGRVTRRGFPAAQVLYWF
jgi:hypothetical protein